MKRQSLPSPIRPCLLIILALTVAFVLPLLTPSVGTAGVEYDSNQLMIKNAEEISEIVRKKIKRAQEIQAKQEDNDGTTFFAEPDAVEELKAAMRVVLARPDQDGTRATAFARIRRELVDLHSLDKALMELTQEGISGLKDSKTPARRAGTYIVYLENLMAEVKPEISKNATFKRMIEEIRDANIQISDELRKQISMRTMAKPISPSETAAKILPKDQSKK
jgi:hypothetical protein